MFAVRRIVVGVEMPRESPWELSGLSMSCQLAVQTAFQVAECARIPVVLVSVLPQLSANWLRSAEEAERASVTERLEAEQMMRHLLEHHAETSKCSASGFSVKTGTAWEELIRCAGNRPDSLLICGTRDQSSLSRMIFGSTGLKLLRLSPGAVWLVKPRAEDNDSTDIVAAIDLSSAGTDVLRAAVTTARWLNARLCIVHAAEQGGTSATLSNAENRLREQLAETDYRTLPFGVKVIVEPGSADQCILRTVQGQKADLLILGTSSRSGASGILPGSTAERLLPELECSVLALKPEGFRSMLPADFWAL